MGAYIAAEFDEASGSSGASVLACWAGCFDASAARAAFDGGRDGVVGVCREVAQSCST